MAREHRMGGLGKMAEDGEDGLEIEDDPRTVSLFLDDFWPRYPGFSRDGAFFNF
jgi:hypothetical protein